MAERFATFRLETAREILAEHRANKRLPRKGLRQTDEELPIAVGNFICKADAEIPALSEDTPGSGAGRLWAFNADDELEEVAGDDGEITIFNLSMAPITADRFLVGVKVQNRRVIIFESCGAGEEESA